MSRPDYSTVTEVPARRASVEQLSALYTRYHFAAEHARDQEVLEVACGCGMGLGYLARVARRVVGGDIDPRNLAIAQETYRGVDRVSVEEFDAEQLPFAAESFDRVLLFEAIYYLVDPRRFLAEALRVLRPGGRLLLSTVHPEWPGFNPSPYSVRYYSAAELEELLQEAGFEPRLFAGFPAQPATARQQVVTLIRRAAVRFDLVPRTMKGKELLKRAFYGALRPLPSMVQEGMAPLGELVPVGPQTDARRYKFLYAIASKRGR